MLNPATADLLLDAALSLDRAARGLAADLSVASRAADVLLEARDDIDLFPALRALAEDLVGSDPITISDIRRSVDVSVACLRSAADSFERLSDARSICLVLHEAVLSLLQTEQQSWVFAGILRNAA